MGDIMRKILCVLISFVLLISQVPTAFATVSTSASSAILFCQNDSKVYYSLNENSKHKIASTTKIMTALLTLEYAKSNNKKVKFTADMVAEGSSMYLKVGEVVTLYDLAVGLLLASGNDAANAVAIAVAGSNEEFAKLMNKRAKQIGMKNTNFENPSGLDSQNHYSTAYDMALLMCEAMKNQDFAKITATKSQTVNFVYPSDKVTTYTNHNRLLSMYEYCIGGKTGYTMASGRCLVTVAQKNSLTFVCVTLNDRQDFNDHINLYNYVFDKYCLKILDDTNSYYSINTVNGTKVVTLASSNGLTQTVLLKADAKKIKRKIKLKKKLIAPVTVDTQVGTVVYKLKGEIIAVHSLVTVENNYKYKKTYLECIKEILKLWLQI